LPDIQTDGLKPTQTLWSKGQENGGGSRPPCLRYMLHSKACIWIRLRATHQAGDAPIP
jgi:hypothetical protein